MFDLKLHGTALFVEAARLYALALGIDRTGTAERLDASAHTPHVPLHEQQAGWCGFEILLRLRLQVQCQRDTKPEDNPNCVAFDMPSEPDRSLLERACTMHGRRNSALRSTTSAERCGATPAARDAIETVRRASYCGGCNWTIGGEYPKWGADDDAET